MSTLITFLAIAALAAFVYHYMPKARQGQPFHLEQFRPAAPLAGTFDDGKGPTATDADPQAGPTHTEDLQSSNRALD